MMTIASGRRGWSEGAYVVRRPRATDAIGGALRRCFSQSLVLPEEMLRLVDRLDCSPRRN